MNKWISCLMLCSLFVFSQHVSAATVTSGKPYMPSTKYYYSIYDVYGQPRPHLTLDCEKPMPSYLYCAHSGGYYTYYVTKNMIGFYEFGDVTVVVPYVFPMKAGKTYYKTAYEGASPYNYHYTVIQTNLTKKIGKKTYRHIIKIRNNVDNSYTYIAKGHGIVLITAKEKGKQVAVYKVKNYYKK